MRVCHVRAVLFAFLLSPVAADSFLSDKLLRSNPVHNVLDHTPATAPACEHAPTGPIETTMCDYESVESVNEQLTHNLNALVRTPFFKFFQVDLYRDCPFWEENFICANKECAITTVDESDVPVKWRAAALSKIESTSMERLNQQPGCYSRESDFCFLDDNTESLYFDLSLVPERYTGYSGPSAHHVWNSIYEENCFGVSEASLLGGADSSLSPSVPDALSEMSNSNDDGLCMEKRVYYKIISGLHASISTHICHEYLNQSTLEFEPNLQCFVTRIASHPERLQYIYFNTVLLLRAVARIGPYLNAYDYCSSGTREDDKETLFHIGKVVDIAQEVGKFDETMLFRGDDAAILKEEFKAHFRNVSRIMDCVGCDKCRLWGKVQTTGLATALKILFELDEKALHPDADLLQRSEVVALINTLHRFSESLEFVNGFRSMWRKTSSADSDKLIKEARSTSSSKARPSPAAGASGEYVGERGLPYWIELCKKGAGDCVDVVLEVLKGVIKTVGKLFSPSGKDRGPMGVLGPEINEGEVEADMILLDPQDSDAPSKLDLPPLGPTLRFPEPAVGSASITGSGGRTIRQRPSLSSVNSTSTSLLLPDYDSSQAEHAQGVVSSLSLRPQWKRARRRFWNSVFWALGIYGACSLVFGIPYLSYKLIHEEHSKGTRHFPSHSPPPLSPLPYPGSTNSTGEDRSVVNDSACNDWGSSSMKDLLTRSMNRTLRGTNTFTFMANISPHSNSTSPLTGSLIIDLNPDAEAAFPEFLSSIRASSIDLDDAIRLCVEQQGTSATIAFYLPDNLGSRDHLTINLTLLLPQSSTFVPKDLVTYLPQFTQTFGNFSSIKPFNKVSVDGAFAKVYAMSLHGKHISVKTSLAEISGNYDSSDSLSLDTIGAPITANITMRNPNNRKKRSFLSIDNGNGDVLAHVILIAPTPPTTLFTRSLGLLSPPRSPPFFISAKTFNSPLTLDIVHHFSTPPSNLHVDAHNNMGACTVTLDDKYQGTYEVQAKLATASVEDEVASEDPNPLFGGAKRQHSRDYQAANWKSGWVGWKRPSSNQGHVQVDSSMAPSMLRWH